MTITNIIELKQESYLMKNGEKIAWRGISEKTDPFFYKNHCREFNSNGSTLVFYDEESKCYVVPIPGNTLTIFENILHKAGYLKNYTMQVPLSNGFDTPELKDKWEAIRRRISLIA